MGQQLSISESEWRVMKIYLSNSPQTLPNIGQIKKKQVGAKQLFRHTLPVW